MSKESVRQLKGTDKEKLMDFSRNLKRNFGLTVEEYNKMFTGQEGLCNICNRPEWAILHGKLKRLSVDHNHITGKIRGLLCTDCNGNLGWFEKNRKSVENYLDSV